MESHPRTDYGGHDVAYQRKRQDPAYGGWGGWDSAAGFEADWQFTWQPLLQRIQAQGGMPNVATRYIGDSNDILQEVMAAGFALVDVKLVPPQHAEDFADVQAIARKPRVDGVSTSNTKTLG